MKKDLTRWLGNHPDPVLEDDTEDDDAIEDVPVDQEIVLTVNLLTGPQGDAHAGILKRTIEKG